MKSTNMAFDDVFAHLLRKLGAIGKMEVRFGQRGTAKEKLGEVQGPARVSDPLEGRNDVGGAHDSPRASLQLQRRLKQLVRCHSKPILPRQLFCVAFLIARYERKGTKRKI